MRLLYALTLQFIRNLGLIDLLAYIFETQENEFYLLPLFIIETISWAAERYKKKTNLASQSQKNSDL